MTANTLTSLTVKFDMSGHSMKKVAGTFVCPNNFESTPYLR